MEDELDESNSNMMIEMADKKKKGEVDEEDFILLMKECGLIPEEIEEPESEHKSYNSELERAL